MRSVGLKTIPEIPDPTRSECHNWCSHPAWHFYTTLAGITPTAIGFGSALIEPRLGPLAHLRVRLVHPGGFVTLDARDGANLHGSVELPAGVPGVLAVAGMKRSFRGRMEF